MAKEFVGVRLPPDLIEAAKAVAESEHRTLSNYILTLIVADIERRRKAQISSAMKEQHERNKKALEEHSESPPLRLVAEPGAPYETASSAKKKRAR
jgi:hypothetical protein